METCFGCHGTEVKVVGMQELETKMGRSRSPISPSGPIKGLGGSTPMGATGPVVPVMQDTGSRSRSRESPYTCAQCHLEPDVPAWNIYHESKHGNIYASKSQKWNFTAVPWKVGKDFQALTCASCHNSLITTPDGKPVSQRSHDFGARLWG